MGEVLERVNREIEVTGFSFQITETDVDAGFRTIVCADGRKLWFKAERRGEILAAWWADWRANAKSHSTYQSEKTPSTGDLRALNKISKEIEKERGEKALQAKLQVEELLNGWGTQAAGEEADYLVRKKLTHSNGVLVRRNQRDAQKILVIPMQDEAGEIWNAQQIFRSGKKVFHPKARVKGLFHKISGNAEKVLVGEGYATCLAAHLATGFEVYCAFSVKNLESIVRLVLGRELPGKIILLGDWDGDTFEKSGVNPGMLECQKLALKYKVGVAVPECNKPGNVDFADNWFDGLDLAARIQDTVDFRELRESVFEKPKKPNPDPVGVEVRVDEALILSPEPEIALPGDAVLRKSAAPPPDMSHIIEPPKQALPNYNALDVEMLPDIVKSKRGGVKVLGTLRNFEAIMDFVGSTLRYNVILKDQEWFIPGEKASVDNYKNVLYARVVDLCQRVGFPLGSVDHYLTYLCDHNQFNPVAAWIESKPWDGISRLEDLFNTVKVVGEAQDAQKMRMKKTFIRKWMLMALAAAYRPTGVAAPGMLVFQGAQYIGKTKWLLSLTPKELNLSVDGKIVDTKDKDSIKQTVCFWLVELGELEATFKKSDIASLKAFLTRDRDMFRPAYAKSECNFVRRTVFFGSVNARTFLADKTGNRRYWTLDVDKVYWDHGLDMQQIWAELLCQYKAGGERGQWWLDDAEMAWLNEANREFEVPDTIEERLVDWGDWSAAEGDWLNASQVLIELGERATNADAQRCSAAVRRLNGNRGKCVRGAKLLWVPKRPLRL